MAAGEEAAFAELFRGWYPKIYDAGLRLTRSHEAAEELVQDVFMKVWLKRETLPAVQDFGAFVYTMARNQFLNGLQRKARLRKITVELAASNPRQQNEVAEDAVMDKHYRVLLEQAIGQLTVRQQQVYRLTRQQGMKREEVAAELGLGAETVKEHLEKAVKNIRAYLVAHSDALPPGALLVITLWLQHLPK